MAAPRSSASSASSISPAQAEASSHYRLVRLDQGHQYVKGAPAELSGLAVHEQIAAVRQNPEPPEINTRR
jgi:hypothetical protein